MKSVSVVCGSLSVIFAFAALWTYTENQRLLNENERLKFSDSFNEKRIALMGDQLRDMEYKFNSSGTYADGYRDALIRTQAGSYADGYEAAKQVYGNGSYEEGYHNAILQFDYAKKEELKAKESTNDKVSKVE